MGKGIRILLGEFHRKVRTAVSYLKTLCPDGEPTHEQIFESVIHADLPVFFDRSNYRLDPSAMIVYLVAYENAGNIEINHYFQIVRKYLIN